MAAAATAAAPADAAAELRILPFGAVLDLRGALAGSPRRVVRSIAGLIAALRDSPGDRDKPVRLLHDEGSGVNLVVKFGLGDEAERQPCVAHELRALTVLGSVRTPHIVRCAWGGTATETVAGEALPLPSVACCIEFVAPLRGKVHTLRQLAASCTDVEWRGAMLQVLFTLYALQCARPGFRHNDCKADNVLVTDAPAEYCDARVRGVAYAIDGRASTTLPPAMRTRRVWRLSPPSVWTKIIDFELCSTPSDADLRSPTVVSSDATGDSLARDYGLSLQRCDVFDIHLLAFDVLQAGKTNPVIRDSFAPFMHAFLPAPWFDVLMLTRQYRLSVGDQARLQEQLGPHVLLHMLAHPFFHHLRESADAPADFEVRVP